MPESPIQIWALLGARAGDNDQVLALAKALGLPFEVKPLDYNGLHRLGPRLLGRSLASLTRAARTTIVNEPPPDLTISTGHRSVPVVRALRHRSRGTMRSIHIGFPRVSPGHFDLVIATPQYPIADHPNLLRLPYALTGAAVAAASQADQPPIATVPAPRRLLVVGGPTLFWKLDVRSLRETLSGMIEEARAEGGSVLVTTSPRTPAAVRGEIASMLANSPVPTLLAEPGELPSYESLLGLAHSIRVTADSVSMISDAIWTGKPMALIPIAKSSLGRVAFRLADLLAPGRQLYPQDLRFFWRALADLGVTERPSKARTSAQDQMNKVLERTRPIVRGSRR